MFQNQASSHSLHPRSDYDARRAERLIHEGIGAVKAGLIDMARPLLEEAAGLKADDSRPWLWLSATTEDPEQQRLYLERALAADPNDGAAVRGMMILTGKYSESAGREIDRQAQIFQCPQCGGRIAFDIHQQEVACQYCGYVHQMTKTLAADAVEQSINNVLVTGRGQRWAEDHLAVVCERCGAHSLLPPETTSDHCPYCGSNRVVQAKSDQDLIEPQLVALLRVDREKALQRLRTWLSKGGLTPGGLVSHAERIQLQVAYFPIWAFDGILEIPWRGEINEGSNDHPRWVSASGVETEMFDDVIIPGLKSQSRKELEKISPFNLKDLLAFDPHYLAGWPALTYDRPLSQASLQAREAVMGRVRPFLIGRASNGHDMRNFNSGSPNWQAMMFKLLLMPLWVGTYSYRGKTHRILINGQTGKVSGSRPRNYLKLLGVALGAMSAALILIILIAIGLFLIT